jgi:hypothetical protein
MTKELEDAFDSFQWYPPTDLFVKNHRVFAVKAPAHVLGVVKKGFIADFGSLLRNYRLKFPKCAPRQTCFVARAGALALYEFVIADVYRVQVVADGERVLSSCYSTALDILERMKSSREYHDKISARGPNMTHAALVALIHDRPADLMDEAA